ncbi:MAG: hypothetical protein ACSHX9_09415 [Luteolibacter sp.]
MKASLLACLAATSFASALEVHEWGTFTVLSGANGVPVSWYQPGQDLAALPDFVGKSGTFKSGVARVRMETPVIYFYTDKPQHVSVSATFKEGAISETFPFSASPISLREMPATWSGTLYAPDDAEALALIPEEESPDPHEPYSAARNVPDAWIFKSDLEKHPYKHNEALAPQAEKFIFYRGAGNSALPMHVMLGTDKTVAVHNYTQEPTEGIALNVSDGMATWKVIPVNEDSNTVATVKLDAAPRPVSEVEEELATHWISALTEKGLTPDEAAAMVATWRATWFREPGTRVLSIVPRSHVDAVLPLEITPKPEKIERVFVARHEVISDVKTRKLAAILTSGSSLQSEIAALELGRFSSGAAEIAAEHIKYEMLNRFRLLSTTPETIDATSAR